MDYFHVPDRLWRKIKKLFPKSPKPGKRGRPRKDNRAILNGIWYVMWTGCQWKAIHKDWFGVSSSVLHQRFQAWRSQGIFEKMMKLMVKFYAKQRQIKWKWQSIDSKSCPAPLGGSQTGKNPTDRAKAGSKIHVVVDKRGAPLGIHITAANLHDKCAFSELMSSFLVKRPKQTRQHLCGDKGYDAQDLRQWLEQAGYKAHIKHRRRPNDPPPEPCNIPSEAKHPARRWVVERTFSWLNKRRSLRVRWCKKVENWMAFVHFACAHILFNLAFLG